MKLSLGVGDFAEIMRTRGWVVFDAALDQTVVNRMLVDLATAWETCRAVMTRNGVIADADLTVHHLIGQGSSFLEYIDRMEPLMPYLEEYFQGKFILNSFGGAINVKGHASYAQRVHRDIRSFSGDVPLMLNTLVMLDAFTAENGATWLLSGSHLKAEKPSDEEFFRCAIQCTGSPGSILLFNSNVWHAGGHNQTDSPRRSVTPMFCRPFLKQQFDYPRALGYDKVDSLMPHTRQVLGYNARVPATLEEWYQPRERRMYRSDQG